MNHLAKIAGLFALALLSWPAARAEEDALSGKLRLNFGAQSGNNQNLYTNSRIELKWDSDLFVHDASVAYAVGYANGKQTRNRAETILSLGIAPLPGLVTALRSDILAAPFDGYELRAFVGVDMQYVILQKPQMIWKLSLAPGYLFEKTTNANSSQLFALIFGSVLEWQPIDKLAFELNTKLNYTNSATILVADVNIDAPLFGGVMIGINAQASYNFHPPDNKRSEDLITGINISYQF